LGFGRRRFHSAKNEQGTMVREKRWEVVKIKHWNDQRKATVSTAKDGVSARAYSIASSRCSRLTYLTGLIEPSIGFCI
jgi:hypothetical protein